MGCGHHGAAWRRPQSPIEQLGDISYYEQLAQSAERGLFDAVFFADGHTVGEVGTGPRWFPEPLTAMAAMARATSQIGLVSTVSETCYTPFHAARVLASVDHISKGRIGWNVVTSMFDAEVRNHGMGALPDHDQRYSRAAEFIEVVLKLWDSWEDDALVLNRGGLYADPARVRAVGHSGEHFRIDGPLMVPRLPQGRPVLFQAGVSGPGRELAARYAEGIYAVAYDLASGQEYDQDVKRRIAVATRDPDVVMIMPGLVTCVGSTQAQARAKQTEGRRPPADRSVARAAGNVCATGLQ
jgi:FMN-dependent oxidoreductase (nitrilotriacetate monooxygenase family)